MRYSVRLAWFWLDESCDGACDGIREPERDLFLLGDCDGPLAASFEPSGVLERPGEAFWPELEPVSAPDAAIIAFAFAFPSRIMSLPSAFCPDMMPPAAGSELWTSSSPGAPFCASCAPIVFSWCNDSCDWTGGALEEVDMGDGIVYVRGGGRRVTMAIRVGRLGWK